MIKDFRNIINGIIYGATLIVPGVSATIFAIMLGFYDELIGSINHFRENYRKNIRYLAAFLLGIAVGAVLFSSVVLYFLDRFPLQTMVLFMGLLAGTVPLIASKADMLKRKISISKVLLTVLFLSALLAISRFASVYNSDTVQIDQAISILLILYILLAGIINGATLVIPGLSGAFLLLIMGIYPLVIGSISSVAIYLGNPGNISLLVEICFILLPFGIGGVLGLLCMARLMEKLMRDHYEAVYASILGLVLGSLIIILIDSVLPEIGQSVLSTVLSVILFIAGSLAAYMIAKRCDH